MTGSRPLTASSTSSGFPTTNVFRLRTGRPLTALVQDWKPTVEARLQELVRLARGWDGYQGQPVSFGNAVFAFRMLESTCSEDTPVPEIVPGSSGDLQLEWHLSGGEIELHVRAPNDVHAWRFLAGDSQLQEELTLSTDFSLVARWLRDLTETSLASRAAAA